MRKIARTVLYARPEPLELVGIMFSRLWGIWATSLGVLAPKLSDDGLVWAAGLSLCFVSLLDLLVLGYAALKIRAARSLLSSVVWGGLAAASAFANPSRPAWVFAVLPVVINLWRFLRLSHLGLFEDE